MSTVDTDSHRAEKATINAIETNALTKTFSHHRAGPRPFTVPPGADIAAVENLDLAIPQGEIFGLIGPNGAGKTTLIKMLCTLLLPSAGSARICGYDVTADADRVREMVGLVASNERSFYWRLTGRQNLEFFAELYHLHGREAKRWIDELFEVLDLRDLAEERFDSYSTGAKQRMAIARGLLSKPRILFLDEPTKGLDPMMSVALIEFIRERILKLWKQTIVITTHNMREIERLCNRIGIMHHGRMLACGRLAELRSMVTGHVTYLLKVTAPAERYASSIGQIDGLVSLPKLTGDGIELEVDVRKNERALSQTIQIVIRQGGEVLGCQTVEPSLDQILGSLVQASSAQQPGQEGQR